MAFVPDLCIQTAKFINANSMALPPPALGGGVLSKDKQSELFAKVMGNNEFSPLLKNEQSWTKCAPYKEQRHFRTPSESIGNNYSPGAADLKLEYCAQAARLGAPSPRKKVVLPGVLSQPLEGSGADFATSATAKADGFFRFTDQSSRPSSPVQQMKTMRVAAGPANATQPTSTDVDRYVHYYKAGIPKEELPSIEIAMLQIVPSTGGTEIRPVHANIADRLPHDLVNDPAMEPFIEELTAEVADGYNSSQRLSILNYILEDPAERARLRIANVPTPFACSTIRAPVPWHLPGHLLFPLLLFLPWRPPQRGVVTGLVFVEHWAMAAQRMS